MSHWAVVPILLPAFAAVFLLLAARQSVMTQRAVGVLSTLALVGAAAALLAEVGDGSYRVYALGDWPAPFGIVLVVDRLGAMMVLLTSVLALLSLAYAVGGWDTRGPNYHALFQFQLMGLNGAFLTGDVFNLFVFFEILLIASYGLLLHGGGPARVRAGLKYVVFNLLGSALFLIALAILYGTLGTLNMADLAVRVTEVAAGDVTLVRIGALLLLVVFAVKAAVLPLYFWLPETYASASPPVAALFAIMTKVGVYATVRVFTLVFGVDAGPLAGLALPLLLTGGMLTLLFATVGVVASGTVRRMTAYLVIASVGTLLIGLGVATADALTAALYYLVHSTVALAALFLLADLIGAQRGELGDRIAAGPAVGQPALLGSAFFVGAVAVAGMPPLSGFIGKALLLRGALESPSAAWVYAVVLGTSLLTLVALARAGSLIFWKTEARGEIPSPWVSTGTFLPVGALLAISALLVLGAGPFYGFFEATAAQLLDPGSYVSAVLGAPAAE